MSEQLNTEPGGPETPTKWDELSLEEFYETQRETRPSDYDGRNTPSEDVEGAQTAQD